MFALNPGRDCCCCKIGRRVVVVVLLLPGRLVLLVGLRVVDVLLVVVVVDGLACELKEKKVAEGVVGNLFCCWKPVEKKVEPGTAGWGEPRDTGAKVGGRGRLLTSWLKLNPDGGNCCC